MEIFSVPNALLAFGAFFVYCVLLAIYRLYFSPSCQVPRPKACCFDAMVRVLLRCRQAGSLRVGISILIRLSTFVSICIQQTRKGAGRLQILTNELLKANFGELSDKVLINWIAGRLSGCTSNIVWFLHSDNDDQLIQYQGPIVRISPYELHINDPEYYDELYVGPTTRRSENYTWTTKQFGPSTSVFATNGHELHRIRRAAIAPFFSIKSVQRLEPSVQSVIDRLILRFKGLRGTGKVINILHVYCALTLDVISEYSFGRADGALDRRFREELV